MRNRPRTATRKKQPAQRSTPMWIWWVVGAAALALVGFVFLRSTPSASTSTDLPTNPGEAVAVMAETSHVTDGTDPGPFNSNPPTSGKHYPTSLTAGFYDEGSTSYTYPEGYLVHNLEHGYIIFWYNCALLDSQGCTQLKDQLRGVLEAENNFKVIAFPWSSIDQPVVATSWGRMLKFNTFDPKIAQQFVVQNRNKAPEPQAE